MTVTVLSRNDEGRAILVAVTAEEYGPKVVCTRRGPLKWEPVYALQTERRALPDDFELTDALVQAMERTYEEPGEGVANEFTL